MGAYVNPPDMNKQDWLTVHGTKLTADEVIKWTDFTDLLPVVVLDNGMFLAAGIAYDAAERDAFMQPDGRDRTYYAVPKNKLLEVSQLKNYIGEQK